MLELSSYRDDDDDADDDFIDDDDCGDGIDDTQMLLLMLHRLLELYPCDNHHRCGLDYEKDHDDDDDAHKCVLYMLVPFCRRQPELL